MNATLESAVELCVLLESVATAHGFHVALTGGTLYKTGERKDIDIVVYRIRQMQGNVRDLYEAFLGVGLKMGDQFGFVTKFLWNEFKVDILYPEHNEAGYYPKLTDIGNFKFRFNDSQRGLSMPRNSMVVAVTARGQAVVVRMNVSSKKDEKIRDSAFQDSDAIEDVFVNDVAPPRKPGLYLLTGHFNIQGDEEDGYELTCLLPRWSELDELPPL